MDETQYFCYGTREIEYLKSRDTALGRAMDEIGPVRRAVIPDLFAALMHAIIGQQISTKAHETVWRRFQERFQPLTPSRIDSLSAEELQRCGMTMKKASYLKSIARSAADGRLDLDQLQTLSDADVCRQLVQMKGVGVWTAEMLMIFSMQRMDVLSWGDLAILRGLRMLYRHREITPRLFAKYRKRYSPYATVASLYLWEISRGACAGLVDPAAGRTKK